jgi:thiamine biosynthesis lipoprotein
MLALLALVATGGSPSAQSLLATADRSTVLVTRDAFLMGTRVQIAMHAASRNTGLEKLNVALRVLEETEREFSTWREDSAISALNRHPVGRAWQAPASTCRTLFGVFAWHRETGGSFDPGIGALTDAWSIHGTGRVPSPQEVTSAAARAGLSLFAFDADRCTATRTRDATIDVGAFGKGEALDRVEAALGHGAWMVDLGGQIHVGGSQPGDAAWPVDIAHPLERDRPHVQVKLRKGSISTSGTSERDLSHGDARVGHIIDPRTGRPAAFVGSVAVWHRSGLGADALSTALSVMGPEEGMRWAEARGAAAIFLIPEATDVRTAATSAWTRFATGPE